MAITETRTLPAQFIEDLGRDYGKQISALTSLPMDTSKFAPTVAAQDPLQTAAYTQATDATTGLGAYQPFLTKATTAADAATALTGTGAGTGAGSIASYMSPYQSDVISTALAEFDKQAAMRQQDISDAAVRLGGFGGGREGVMQSEYQSTSDRNRAALQAGLLQQGFQQAQQARQQDLANQRGIATLQSTLGGGAQQLAQQQISGLGTLGGAQQAQAQAIADAQRQAAQTAAYEPYQRLGTYGAGVASLISGYPAQYQTGQTPSASPLQTALGVGTGLAGIYGGLTGKNPFQAIGNVFGMGK
tara:strand:+ start:123 stop:1031 length:909 start_codon:yes stop_codon:yes gene_type:complete